MLFLRWSKRGSRLQGSASVTSQSAFCAASTFPWYEYRLAEVLLLLHPLAPSVRSNCKTDRICWFAPVSVNASTRDARGFQWIMQILFVSDIYIFPAAFHMHARIIRRNFIRDAALYSVRCLLFMSCSLRTK